MASQSNGSGPQPTPSTGQSSTWSNVLTAAPAKPPAASTAKPTTPTPRPTKAPAAHSKPVRRHAPVHLEPGQSRINPKAKPMSKKKPGGLHSAHSTRGAHHTHPLAASAGPGAVMVGDKDRLKKREQELRAARKSGLGGRPASVYDKYGRSRDPRGLGGPHHYPGPRTRGGPTRLWRDRPGAASGPMGGPASAAPPPPPPPKISVPVLALDNRGKNSLRLSWTDVCPKPPPPPSPPPSPPAPEEPEQADSKDNMDSKNNKNNKDKDSKNNKDSSANGDAPQKDAASGGKEDQTSEAPAANGQARAASGASSISNGSQDVRARSGAKDSAPSTSASKPAKVEAPAKKPTPPPQPKYTCTYRLERAADNAPNQWTVVYEGPRTYHNERKLKAGCTYTFRIQAFVFVPHPAQSTAFLDAEHAFSKRKGQMVSSRLSQPSSFQTSPSVPKQPAAPKLMRSGKNTIAVSWDPPHDSGAAIDMYTLESDAYPRSTGVLRSVYSGENTQFECVGLEPNKEYRFKVKASNRVGYSHFSPLAVFSTSADAPSCPLNLGAASAHSRKSNAISLSWRKPADDHGQKVTRYTLQMSVAGRSGPWQDVYQGPSLQAEVRSLKPATRYHFRVAASNAVGNGDFSAPVPLKTAAAVPDAPGGWDCSEVTSSSLAITWEAPTSNGFPITEYTLECRGEDEKEFSQALTTRRPACTLHALQPAHAYTYRVMAANKLGNSPYSAEYTFKTLAACPSKPQKLRVTGTTSTTMSLAWEPAEDHGSHITLYNVEYSIGQVSPALAKSRKGVDGVAHGQVALQFAPDQPAVALIRDLQACTKYFVRIQAVNGVGPSEWSAPTTAATSLPEPAQPTAPTLTSNTQDTLALQWGKGVPSKQRDGTQLQWALDMRADTEDPTKLPEYKTVYEGPETHFEVKGLRKGQTYMFRLKAINSAGTSLPSATVRFSTKTAVPKAVNGLAASAVKGTSLRLSWESADAVGAPVLNYLVDSRPVGKSRFSRAYSGSATSKVIKGLKAATEFEFRICAVNRAGQGPFTTAKFRTKHDPPPPPVAPTVEEQRDSSDSSGSSSSSSASTSPHSLVVSWRCDSSSRKRSKGKKSSSPTSASAPSSFTLEWMSVGGGVAGGAADRQHSPTSSYTQVYSGSASTFTIPGAWVQGYRTLRFRVIAANKYGRSPPSKEATVHLEQPVPESKQSRQDIDDDGDDDSTLSTHTDPFKVKRQRAHAKKMREFALGAVAALLLAVAYLYFLR